MINLSVKIGKIKGCRALQISPTVGVYSSSIWPWHCFKVDWKFFRGPKFKGCRKWQINEITTFRKYI